jgi:adenylate cyclase
MPGDRVASSRAPTRGGGLPAEEVRAELEQILAHRDFEASARTRQFLRFVVEETLAGRGHRLKGYTVAVEVFGRARDFDATLDPIVRIQAGRLRRALEHYYLVAGGSDPIVISVPRGGYVPAFARNDRPAAPSALPAESALDSVPRLPLGVTVAVLPLREIPFDAGNGFFADGLTEELCNELSRYLELGVIPCRREMLPAGEASDHVELSRRLGARFLLDGSVRRSEEVVKVSARLVDGPQGQQVWAEGYTRPLSAGSLIEIQEEIARSVSAAVGCAYGVIPRQLAAETRKVAPAHLSTYEAVLRWFDYENEPSPEAGAPCLAALRAAVEREPEYGPAWAALAELKAHAYILDLPGVEDPLARNAEYARKGAALAPTSQLARSVLAHSHYLRGEREAFLREIEAMLQLNPGSPFYVGSAGYLLVLAGEYERGRTLLERAIAMNPFYPRWFNHAVCAYHYQRGDYEAAHQETLKAAFGVYFWGPLLRAAVLGQLRRTAEAEAAAAELVALVPDFESRAQDLTSRPILSETIVDALLDGLRKAGLRLEDG